MWMDIACIVFTCVTMNHLGLISAIENAIHRTLWIVNCPKCSTFWFVLAYCSVCCNRVATIPSMCAVSFLCSYLAVWLELFESFIDTLFMKLYEKIVTTGNDGSAPADPECSDSAGSVSEL